MEKKSWSMEINLYSILVIYWKQFASLFSLPDFLISTKPSQSCRILGNEWSITITVLAHISVTGTTTVKVKC